MSRKAARKTGRTLVEGNLRKGKPSKMVQARAMFNRATKRVRSVLVPRFQEKLKLTKAAASTYFQRIKTEASA